MEEHNKLGNGLVKRTLLLFGALAFLSIFATIDTSEHFRTWRTARSWTPEQKSIALALDVGIMYRIIAVAIACDTLVIVATAIGALLLGISVALEKAKGIFIARLLGLAAASIGFIYSILIIIYKIRIGERQILKGPIFNYNLALQPPILISALGFIALFILWIRLFRDLSSSADSFQRTR